MIGTIRKCRICTRGGILAAIIVAAMFTSAQVACLTHTHCHEADCFDRHEESHDSHGHPHHDHNDRTDHDCEAETHCDEEHHDHDIHHHSNEGHAHPQRRFTAPVIEMPFADEAGGDTPVITPAEYLPVVDESPPMERYGPTFAERAPPLS